MTFRIAVGGFLHESHSFAPHPARYEDFVAPGGHPPLSRGWAMLGQMRGSAASIAGAIAALEQAQHIVVPLAWGMASPSGPIEDAAFERIAALTSAELSAALDEAELDGVFLDLHGAALADSFADAEGELLARVRRIVGDTPIVITLDPHANVTAQMVALCDAIVPYRTYPHIDMKPAGARAITLLLERIQRGAPWAKAFRQLDFCIPITSQCTLAEPMQSVMAAREALAVRPGLAELGFCFGFPYADFADCGPSVACFASDAATAAEAADALARNVASREAEFRLDVMPAAQAVAEARHANGAGPVVLADTQDNPGGGGHGDTTGLLAELVRQGATGAVVCLIDDAERAAACHAAGEGAVLDLALGGRSDGVPFHARAQVLRLTDGRFLLTGPMAGGNRADLGPTALIGIDGVRVVVVSRKMQALDQAILRDVGIEPSEARILALKSSVHFRADFAPIASRIIVTAAPGPVVADPAMLPFRHLRSGVRLRLGEAVSTSDDYSGTTAT